MSALDRFAPITTVTSAALLALLAGRLLYVVVTTSWADDQRPGGQPAADGAPATSTAPLGDEGRLPVSTSSLSTARVAGSGAPGRAIRTRLLVSVGDRAKVRVDGAPMGQSPLVSEYSCVEGAEVKIEVEKPGGGYDTFVRTCTSGTIRVAP